jgi:hypothetical protein
MMRGVTLFKQRHVVHGGALFILRRVRKGVVIFNGNGRYLARIHYGQFRTLRVWLDHFAKQENR